MQNHKWIAPFAAGLLLGWVFALYRLYPPARSADAAAWVQAVGSIAAIAGAFYIGARQAKAQELARQRQAREGERRKRSQCLAIAETAVGYARRLVPEEPSGVLLASGNDADRLGEVVTAMQAIPLHEIGSADVIVAWSGVIKQLTGVRTTFYKVIDLDTLFLDAGAGDNSETARLAALRNAWARLETVYDELIQAMQDEAGQGAAPGAAWPVGDA
jgi:hypothetical protein